MSAELLRRAATVLREHAGAAPRGPWHMGTTGRPYPQRVSNTAAVVVAECFDAPLYVATAPYIVLMHPPVALAVARWLEATATLIEANEQFDGFDIGADIQLREAVAAARAILREGP